MNLHKRATWHPATPPLRAVSGGLASSEPTKDDAGSKRGAPSKGSARSKGGARSKDGARSKGDAAVKAEAAVRAVAVGDGDGVPDTEPEASTGNSAGPLRPARRPRTLLIPVAMLLILPIAVGFYLQRPPPPFTPGFAGPDRLVTNERTFHKPHMPGVKRSEDWRVTSGSLFARHGYGWTGEPDTVLPDAKSTNGTGSAIFRVVSNRADFDDVQVSLRIRIEAITDPADSQAYDGAHIFLRYQNPDQLYGVSVFRRDGLVVVKRKLPGGAAPGRYRTLATAHRPQPLNTWMRVVTRIVTLDSGSVRITVRIDGKLVLVATDRGVGGPPVKAPGRVGLRGDNCQFSFADFRAEAI